MLGLKLNHVSKRGHCSFQCIGYTVSSLIHDFNHCGKHNDQQVADNILQCILLNEKCYHSFKKTQICSHCPKVDKSASHARLCLPMSTKIYDAICSHQAPKSSDILNRFPCDSPLFYITLVVGLHGLSNREHNAQSIHVCLVAICNCQTMVLEASI